MSAARVLLAGAVAAAGAAASRRGLAASPPGGEARWQRVNHRGEPVSLLAGPAAAAGLVAGALAAGGDRQALAAAVAAGTAGGFGLVDDLAEDTAVRTKGLRGHLGALREGRVTTGALKVAGIGTGALVAAALATPGPGGGPGRGSGGRLGWAGDVVATGALVAGGANLLNLFDLRPGRARKVALGLAGAGMVAAPVVGPTGAALSGVVAGASAAGIHDDLAERDMLGDAGANALGAVLGVAVAQAPRPLRLAALGVVVGLTALSERVSFSEVIEWTPVLRDVDAWGRRPAETP